MEQVLVNNSTPRFRMGEGDWFCPDPLCKNINFARRDRCNRCGKEKSESGQKKKLGQEIGKAAAEKSRGLFSADDWQCNKCGNVNWARRQQCNMCNAPKFGEVEERTGYGGGYNERGVVEYIKREDSDDEYDEFGRKKKKRSHSSRRSDDEEEEENPPAPPAAEEEDEDEEEDDEDLSKYDLTGWGGDDDEDGSGSNQQKEKDRNERSKKASAEKRRSRSRSRSPH
ncbi:hypothetical protein LSTR_LSTR011261 [Laodelphax striatellus]|uniref:Zinc finger Ran-binding domain-containing protein 2 n=1 Tax=Laodelphax striatellus TaxID=195883 RepID=A0A482WSE8_LAOST|nr:hypothetical protein LSTR_LSTR011261 [Laodelphax striatellus]